MKKTLDLYSNLVLYSCMTKREKTMNTIYDVNSNEYRYGNHFRQINLFPLGVEKRKCNRKNPLTKQTNLFSQGIKKQKWHRGNPLTKKDKLYRISTFDYITGNGGTLKDVARMWGINHVHEWMVEGYRKDI